MQRIRRRELPAISIIAVCLPLVFARAWADERDLERTKAYLVEKIPIFVSSFTYSGFDYHRYSTHSFDGCRMTIRSDLGFGEWVGVMVDFAASEPIRA